MMNRSEKTQSLRRAGFELVNAIIFLVWSAISVSFLLVNWTSLGGLLGASFFLFLVAIIFVYRGMDRFLENIALAFPYDD